MPLRVDIFIRWVEDPHSLDEMEDMDIKAEVENHTEGGSGNETSSEGGTSDLEGENSSLGMGCQAKTARI